MTSDELQKYAEERGKEWASLMMRLLAQALIEAPELLHNPQFGQKSGIDHDRGPLRTVFEFRAELAPGVLFEVEGNRPVRLYHPETHRTVSLPPIDYTVEDYSRG